MMKLRPSCTVLLLLLASHYLDAQRSPLEKAAMHKTCEDLPDDEISTCTDRWMQDYLVSRVDTSICMADDSSALNYRIMLLVDDAGRVQEAKAYPNNYQDSLDTCDEHIQEILQPLVSKRDFVAGLSQEGRVESRKYFSYRIAPIIQASMPDDSTYLFPEQMPRFVGCEGMIGNDYDKKVCAESQMLMYIYRNLKYPAEARENGVQGTVVVKFVVEKTGMIDSIQIVRDIGGGCGESSRSVVESMNSLDPPFVPGMQRGKAVRVQYTLPVRYKLESGPKRRRRRGGR